MKLIRVFNYDEFNVPNHDGVKVYEIVGNRGTFGIVVFREFVDSQVVSFHIKEPLNEKEYALLFESVLDTAKGFSSKVLLHYTLTPNPFADFILEKGGHILRRREMHLDLKEFVPLETPISQEVELAPFLITPVKENIRLCFETLPEYDKFIFSAFSPQSLSELYTLLYTGRDGVFVPEFSINLYFRGRLAGFIMVNIFSEKKLVISEIMIFSPYQGKGFGKLLLNESLRRMKKKRIPLVSLSVTKKNKRAYNMYEKFGFKKSRDYFVYIYRL